MGSTRIEDVLDKRVRPAPHAIVREMPDGTSIILDTNSEHYFGLDGMGAHFWDVLSTSDSVGSARENLHEDFEVDAARLDSDLVDFLHGLQSRGLVVLDTLE